MDKELKELCLRVKEEIEKKNYENAYQSIADGMRDYPDSGVPHNLMGIWEEQKQNHVGAMKHFRAAWALEPTFLPARWNMEMYGGGNKKKICAYVEEDVPEEQDKPKYKCVYDEKGIGHMVRRQEL